MWKLPWENPRTGFTTSRSEILGGIVVVRLWEGRGFNEEMSSEKLPLSIPLLPPPSEHRAKKRREAWWASFQAHLPGVLNLKHKSLFLWDGEAGEMGVWNSGVSLVSCPEEKAGCHGAGGSHRQREVERGNVFVRSALLPTCPSLWQFLFAQAPWKCFVLSHNWGS